MTPGNTHPRKALVQPLHRAARSAAPRLNHYPINVTLPQRVLRDVLELESVEAKEMAREAGLQVPR